MNDITEAVGEHYRMEAELAQIAVRLRKINKDLEEVCDKLEIELPPICEFCGSTELQERSREIDSDESVYYYHCLTCNQDESL